MYLVRLAWQRVGYKDVDMVIGMGDAIGCFVVVSDTVEFTLGAVPVFMRRFTHSGYRIKKIMNFTLLCLQIV